MCSPREGESLPDQDFSRLTSPRAQKKPHQSPIVVLNTTKTMESTFPTLFVTRALRMELAMAAPKDIIARSRCGFFTCSKTRLRSAGECEAIVQVGESVQQRKGIGTTREAKILPMPS